MAKTKKSGLEFPKEIIVTSEQYADGTKGLLAQASLEECAVIGKIVLAGVYELKQLVEVRAEVRSSGL